MKTPQPTKESLTVELAKVRQSHADWVTSDERRRKEFAKAFNWVKNAEYALGSALGSNHIYKEPQLPSWEQIFVHLGKLLQVDAQRQDALNVISFLKNATRNGTADPKSDN